MRFLDGMTCPNSLISKTLNPRHSPTSVPTKFLQKNSSNPTCNPTQHTLRSDQLTCSTTSPAANVPQNCHHSKSECRVLPPRPQERNPQILDPTILSPPFCRRVPSPSDRRRLSLSSLLTMPIVKVRSPRQKQESFQ